MESIKNCGCKGIRTCLICEEEGKLSKIGDEDKETAQYEYCPHCDLCWPLGVGEAPLYLGRLTLVPEFVTEEEEKDIVAAIDSMEWMPSQSGRRKQDFGPKVNFKKRKGKIGDFRGFPCFTENLIKRLGQHGDLSDFHPVELCHLDYDPGRGSAIEPHIDDTWIWGERLVTLNLVSPTVLIFTPANTEETCDCQTLPVCSSDEIKQCNCNITLDCSLRECSTDVSDYRPVNDKCSSNGIGQDKLKESLVCESKCLRTCPSNVGSIVEPNHRNHNCPVHCALAKDPPKHLISNLDIGQVDAITIHDHNYQCFKLCNHKKFLGCSPERYVNGKKSGAVEAMCTAYRTGQKGPKIEVLVPLPARSLVVVAGCSRHNWFHEIRRKDIVSRRLAMTFRELSLNFTSADSDKILGNELLELGRTFWEMNV